MAKAIIGAVIGYAIWTAIWLGGNAVMLPDAGKVIGEGKPYGAVGPLVGAIGLSVICSLAAVLPQRQLPVPGLGPPCSSLPCCCCSRGSLSRQEPGR